MSDDDIVPLREAERRERAGWEAPNPGFRPPRLDIIDPGEWQGKEPPPRPWLVPGWIPREEVTLLYGVGGAGKSILSLQLMVSAALGLPWAGQPVERAKSLYFSCEERKDKPRCASAIAEANARFGRLRTCPKDTRLPLQCGILREPCIPP